MSSMNQEIEQIKNKIIPLLKEGDVDFAGVFGSFARGDANEKSDIDLLIRFGRQKSLLDLVHLENILSDTLRRKVDLVTEGALSPYIKKYVFGDLQVLYGSR